MKDGIEKSIKANAKGFTLIELMISIAVTSIILIAVFNLFVSNSLSYNVQQSIVNLQEEGRYATQALSQSFMLAGYSESNPAQAALRFKDDKNAELVSVIRTEADASGKKTTAQQYSGNGTGNNTPFDQIIILINGGENCAGAESWPPLTSGSQWKYFYVNQKRQLMCSDSAGNLEPVTTGIDAFQVQYGIDTNNPGEAGYDQPNTYVSAPNLGQRIVAIRFAIVVKSQDMMRAQQKYPANYSMTVLDHVLKNGQGTNNINFSDGHLRRLFFSTIKLRNSQASNI